MLDSATDLKALLKDPSLLATKAYIAGEWVEAADGKTFAVTNPARGDVICHVPDLTREDAARAIAAADKARHEWAARTGKERAAVLRKWYDLMVANADDLGAILTAEMGKPLAEAKGEVIYGAAFVEWFAEEAKRIYGETIPGHQRDKRITVIKQPIGVAASITPWNFPNAMIARNGRPGAGRGLRLRRPPRRRNPAFGAGDGGAGRTRGRAGRGVFGHHLKPRLRHREGVLREPRRPQADLHRLHRGGPHPAAPGRRPGDEMLDGARGQRALHRLR